MIDFILYLGKVSVGTALLYLFYQLFLMKETHFRLNRGFLIGSLIIPLLIPLIKNPFLKNGTETPFVQILDTIQISGNTNIVESHISIWNLLFIVYLVGVLLFTINLTINFTHLISVTIKTEPQLIRGVVVKVSKEKISPFSFWKSIYLNPDLLEADEIDIIIKHESIHMKQYHTIDIIFIEFLKVIFWFNPFLIMIQKALKEVHEFSADQYIKNAQKDIESYMFLLSKSTGYPLEISNNFNKPLILKRMKMMTKKPSNWASTLKVMLAIPLLFGLILVFSIREMSAKAIPDLFKMETDVIVPTTTENGIIVNSNTPKVTTESKTIIVTSEQPKDTIPKKILRFNEVDKPASFPGGMDKMMEYLKNNIQYPAVCREKGIQGIVLVEFVITKKGKIEKVKVLFPVDPALDAEAKRVISKMPKWEPAELNGKKVNSMYQIPINFKLQ